MANDLTTFEILLVKGGAFEETWELFQDDAMLTPTNLSGKSPRILVKFGAETLEWTVAGGHISILAPATDGKVRIQVNGTANVPITHFSLTEIFRGSHARSDGRGARYLGRDGLARLEFRKSVAL